MMEVQLSAEDYVSRLRDLHSETDQEKVFEQLAELTVRAFAGHESACPDEDRNCSECQDHGVHTVDGIIVRVSTIDAHVCCVEHPVIKRDPERILNTDYCRMQMRHGKGGYFVGLVMDLGPQRVDSCSGSLRNKLLGLYSK